MPYVQSERSILYFLHRSARSRGLQAKGEKELVPGLSRVSCGPSETLLSGGCDVCVCYNVFPSVPPSKWPKSSPFIAEGRTRTVHVLTTQRRVNGGGVSEPYSLFLWRRGQWCGPSLRYWGDAPVTSDPVRHGSSSAISKWARKSPCWSSCVDYAGSRGSVGAETEPLWEARQT